MCLNLAINFYWKKGYEPVVKADIPMQPQATEEMIITEMPRQIVPKLTEKPRHMEFKFGKRKQYKASSTKQKSLQTLLNEAPTPPFNS